MKSKEESTKQRLLNGSEWNGGCLVWQKCFVQFYECKYGQISFKNRNWLAHRLMYFLTTGIDPHEKHVMHSCDNGLCINPEHLKLGTAKDNMRDAAKKKRFPEQRKTHCPDGHEYNTKNTIFELRKGHELPHRICRSCKLERQKIARNRK